MSVNDKVHAAMTPEKTLALLAELKAEGCSAEAGGSSQEVPHAAG
jgi:hypothetical protein